MTSEQSQRDLHTALDALETSLETPFVPGELERWMNAVQTAFNEARPLVQQRIETDHPQQLADIEGQDPELTNRVEGLKQEDRHLLEELDKLAGWIDEFAIKVPEVEPDEARMREELNNLVHAGLEFIIRVRTQETALRTWLQEAIERDRGPVD